MERLSATVREQERTLKAGLTVDTWRTLGQVLHASPAFGSHPLPPRPDGSVAGTWTNVFDGDLTFDHLVDAVQRMRRAVADFRPTTLVVPTEQSLYTEAMLATQLPGTDAVFIVWNLLREKLRTVEISAHLPGGAWYMLDERKGSAVQDDGTVDPRRAVRCCAEVPPRLVRRVL